MITKQGDTLDKEIKPIEIKSGDDVVGRTVMELIVESSDLKSQKEQAVRKCKEIYDNVLSGNTPTRAEQLASYTPVMLVNLFYMLNQIPDVRVTNTGLVEELNILLSKFIEDTVYQAGFQDLMNGGWSGYHQVATYGDYYILGSTDVLNAKKGKKKVKKGEKFCEFQGLSVGNVYFNKEATAIHSNSISQSVSRFMVVCDLNTYEAEKMFPKITDIALPGDLPTTLDSETDQRTEEQKTNENKSIQVGFFFDMFNEVYSIRAGSNNAEYLRIEGEEFVKNFSMWWRGKQEVRPPIANFGLYPKSEGIYHAGLIETFYRIAINEGLLQGFMVNNLLDINNAPIMLNGVDGMRANDVLKQWKRGMEEMAKGNRAVIIPTLGGTDVAPVGQNNIGYLTPASATADNERQFAKFEQIVKRMGWNLDYNFSDPTKTLGQTELDIQNVNKNVASIIGMNLDFFEFVYSFAIDRIIKFGDENDDTVFGRDLAIDIAGEQVPMTEVTGQDITVGFLVKLLKSVKESLRIEIDAKSGTAFNDLLETRNLQRMLQVLPQGSPQQLRALSALNMVNGGKPIGFSDIQGQGEPQGMQPLPEE